MPVFYIIKINLYLIIFFMILFIVKIISTRNLKIFLTNKKKIYKQKKIVYLFDKKNLNCLK